METRSIVIALVIGLVAGWLASLLVGGAGGIVGYLISGLIGSFVGSFVLEKAKIDLGIRNEIARAIVTATIGAMPPNVLERLGWTDSDAHAALATASLTRGVASLHARQRRAAFAHFRTTFERSRINRERLGAIVGMMSAASGINLFSAAERFETRLRGENVHAV